MANIGTKTWWAGAPSTWTLAYSMTRSGTTVSCTLTATVSFKNSYSQTYYNDPIKVTLYKDGTAKTTLTIKPKTSGALAGKSYTESYTFTFNQTSGTVALKGYLSDGDSSTLRTIEGTYSVPAAASVITGTTGGYAMSGINVSVTRYKNSFYNRCAIASDSNYTNWMTNWFQFNGGNIYFNETEVSRMFAAHGPNNTSTYYVILQTFTDSSLNTKLGESKSQVNITTEQLPSLSNISNFNVESSLNLSLTMPSKGVSRLKAFVTDSTSGTECYSNTNITTSLNNYSITPTSSVIYENNTTSKQGKIYFYMQYYLDPYYTSSWYKVGESTYNFQQNLCGPTLSSLKYQIPSGDGAIVLLGADGNETDYTNTTNASKLIKSKSNLIMKLTGTVNSGKSATLSRFYLDVPNSGIIEATSGNIVNDVATIQTPALNFDSGTINAVIEDSRGFTSSLDLTINMNDYYIPQFNSLGIRRQPKSVVDPTQDAYTILSATINTPSYMADYILNSNDQDCYIDYQYKIHSDTNWTSYTGNITNLFTQDGNKLVATNELLSSTQFIQTNQYDFRLVIYDFYTKQSGTLSNAVIIPVSAPLIAKRNQRLGVNKVPVYEEAGVMSALDVGGGIHADSYIIVDSFVRSGTNMEVGSYIEFPNAYDGTNSSCTIAFKRTTSGNGLKDYIRVVDDEVFFIKEYLDSNDQVQQHVYELIPFEETV